MNGRPSFVTVQRIAHSRLENRSVALPNDLVNHLLFHIGQAKIATVVTVG
jgi:hypothetical protein